MGVFEKGGRGGRQVSPHLAPAMQMPKYEGGLMWQGGGRAWVKPSQGGIFKIITENDG